MAKKFREIIYNPDTIKWGKRAKGLLWAAPAAAATYVLYHITKDSGQDAGYIHETSKSLLNASGDVAKKFFTTSGGLKFLTAVTNGAIGYAQKGLHWAFPAAGVYTGANVLSSGLENKVDLSEFGSDAIEGVVVPTGAYLVGWTVRTLRDYLK